MKCLTVGMFFCRPFILPRCWFVRLWIGFFVSPIYWSLHLLHSIKYMTLLVWHVLCPASIQLHHCLPLSIALSLRFYLWLLKLFTAWRQIIFANWSAEGNQQDIYSLRSSKKVMLEVPSGKILPTLGGRAFCCAAQSPGTIYPVKYPALTLCQILNAMWKHIFLNKLLICRRVFRF